jgi:hypothetical protein
MIHTRSEFGEREPRLYPKPYKLPPPCPVCGGGIWHLDIDGHPRMTPHLLNEHPGAKPGTTLADNP